MGSLGEFMGASTVGGRKLKDSQKKNIDGKVQPKNIDLITGVDGVKRREKEKERGKREKKFQTLMINILVNLQHKVDELMRIVATTLAMQPPTMVANDRERTTSSRAPRCLEIHIVSTIQDAPRITVSDPPPRVEDSSQEEQSKGLQLSDNELGQTKPIEKNPQAQIPSRVEQPST